MLTESLLDFSHLAENRWSIDAASYNFGTGHAGETHLGGRIRKIRNEKTGMGPERNSHMTIPCNS